MTDKLQDLTRPFPPKYVHTNPSGGGSYVKHHVVNQRLIEIFGTPPDFKMIEIIRGDVEGYTSSNNKTFPPLRNVIVGVVAEMSVIFTDGELDLASIATVQEAGDCEQPHNWKTDGQRLKDAMSDAYKRCAMRLGCGLHLWSQDEYFLHDALAKRERSGIPGSVSDRSANSPAQEDGGLDARSGPLSEPVKEPLT